MSGSLRLYGLLHARLPCPSLSPGVCSDSCPLTWWCYLIILSSAALFSFFLQSFSASGSFAISRLFTSGGRASASAPVLPMNIQGWFPLGMVDLLAVQGTLKSLLQHHSSKASILQVLSFLYGPTLTSIHDHWKNHSSGGRNDRPP